MTRASHKKEGESFTTKLCVSKILLSFLLWYILNIIRYDLHRGGSVIGRKKFGLLWFVAEKKNDLVAMAQQKNGVSWAMPLPMIKRYIGLTKYKKEVYHRSDDKWFSLTMIVKNDHSGIWDCGFSDSIDCSSVLVWWQCWPIAPKPQVVQVRTAE